MNWFYHTIESAVGICKSCSKSNLAFVTVMLASSVAWGQGDVSTDPSVYQVDAENSDIRILVHRAGALSWLGHSHVISVGQLDGRIYVHPEPKQSRFELIIPVQGLIVDDPLLRREEGDELCAPSRGHTECGGNIVDFNDWAKQDLEYINNWSLVLDWKILLKTVPVVLTGVGAK